jgi:predicted pyridoxine 5'-phosphate oxidase superfamily flavin-nucleotide-binding protein
MSSSSESLTLHRVPLIWEGSILKGCELGSVTGSETFIDETRIADITGRLNMVSISDEVKEFVESQHVCYVATSSENGKPNVSPKGSLRVIDDRTLAFCDLFSKKTHKNLQKNPWMGYQFVGTAEEIEEGPLFDRMEKELTVPEKWSPTIKRVIKIDVKEMYDLAPPGEYYLE